MFCPYRRERQRQKLCPHCNNGFTFDKFEIDYIIAWSKGGRAALGNAQLLGKKCNVTKGGK
ncbi:MAG: HNH endonuclease [Clostridiales bacterium]|nr:HNH endonuclease [Clostridiales bacterium]